jgi:membrane protein DedA with SNARE-associated domain
MSFDPDYGLITLFGLVLAQQLLGSPVPAWPALLLSGAYAVVDPLHGVAAILVATVASIAGSLPWYWAGRRYGQRVLRLACRISISPGACVHKTEAFFERHGAAALLVSKFVPGFVRVAPPLAGAFGFRVPRFAFYFAMGSALGAFAPLALGAAVHGQIEAVVAWLGVFGGPMLAAIAAVLLACFACRWLARRRIAAAPVACMETAALAEMRPRDRGRPAVMYVSAEIFQVHPAIEQTSQRR